MTREAKHRECLEKAVDAMAEMPAGRLVAPSVGIGWPESPHEVIVGFDDQGNVVVNDPASHLIKSDDAVRTTYDREQFENTWIPHSGGIAYVIRPAGSPLPPRMPEANW
jgi:hypothetical protein